MKTTFDVIIIGSGPAGMFAALELIENQPRLKIAIFEQGSLRARNSGIRTSGWGGAGAFSDGKLILTSRVGGQLDSFVPKKELNELIAYVEQRYLSFLPKKINSTIVHPQGEEIEGLKKKALAGNLYLVDYPVRHFGSNNAYNIVENIRKKLIKKGVQIFLDTPVTEIAPPTIIANGKTVSADKIIAATGRVGAEWLVGQEKKLGLKLSNSGVDIGVRVETLTEIASHLTDFLYDPKIIYYSKTFNDKVRTFCVCPYGFVIMEDNSGLFTTNGESRTDEKSPNTNFAILVTIKFTDPFNEPERYMKNIATLANLLGGKVLVQRLEDLKRGRRSTPTRMAKSLVRPTLAEATPGDLSLVIPHRQMTGILEMLEALDAIMPGINSNHTLLYGLEAKFYSSQVETREGFETMIDGFYAAGDGSGYTRGLVQSSIQGILVARHILNLKKI